ncbi:MAG: prolyl oligopeptidase family serine peptidase [Candidatus Daviesbacteria bacterium]|nr:prolyl oligopeptidase family serine peptidase [Candidatus Daviesbacteria bacterium]
MKKYQISETGKHNKKVVFLLEGWHSKLWMYWLFSRILSLRGYYCITYAYDSEIFSPDTQKTVKYLNIIQNDILLRLKTLKNEGYVEFNILGTSLGSMLALMVADKSPDISKVILNTIGIDISETVWGWNKIYPGFKEELIRQNFTPDKLKKVWKSITPVNNISNLKNKKILVYLSKKDEVIPYDLGMSLVEEFKKRNYKYSLKVNNYLKHFYAGFYNLMNAKYYLKFLAD